MADKIVFKKLSDMPPVEFVTSGIKEIDMMTGGLPRGRITEIHGKQGVGKTSFASKAAAEMSKTGKVLFFDAESALNPQRLVEYGANDKNLFISNEYILETIADQCIEAVGKYDIIVVDSIASLVLKNEANGDTGDFFIGRKAAILGQWMRKMIGPLGKSNTAFVFINQLRDNVGVLYGEKVITPGGHAIPYAASLRLQLSTTKADRIKGKDGFFKGHKVKVTIIKSRVCPPHQETQFKLDY